MTVLSVVIPAHNAASYLGDALDSVLSIRPAGAEVIVVDDASSDTTPAVLERYADRIRVLRRTARSGPGVARNAGAAAATGDVLAFHDADDLMLPTRFSALLPELERDPELDLVFGNGVKIYATAPELPFPAAASSQSSASFSGARPVIRRAYARRLRRHVGVSEMLLGSWVYPQATCVRAAAFHALGGFYDGPVEDWEFGLRAALRLRMKFVDAPVFAYRQHPASMTMQRFDFVHLMLTLLERFVAEHPEIRRLVPQREIDHALARYLARAAQHHARRADAAGARAYLQRAVAHDPTNLRYRWRLLRLRLRGAPRAATAGPA